MHQSEQRQGFIGFMGFILGVSNLHLWRFMEVYSFVYLLGCLWHQLSAGFEVCPILGVSHGVASLCTLLAGRQSSCLSDQAGEVLGDKETL